LTKSDDCPNLTNYSDDRLIIVFHTNKKGNGHVKKLQSAYPYLVGQREVEEPRGNGALDA
jgi:hypothetical protein